jgi:DNA-directed RNA polymerase subunit RPC12/RpoP
MSDYISREAAIAYIREQSEEMSKAFEELGGESGIYADAYNDLAEDFHRIPAADVEPVRHCKWLRNDYDWNSLTTYRCTACGEEFCFEIDEDLPLLNYNYCPNCGAKMDLEDNHEN